MSWGSGWLPLRRLPDGRRGQEGLAARLLRHVSVHRVDAADGGVPGLAALCGPVPAGPGGGAGDLHLPGLHPRDEPRQHEGHLRLLPPGDDRPGHPHLLLDGPQPRLELAQPRCPHLPHPLRVRALLHPGEPALARVQRGRGPRLQVNVANQVYIIKIYLHFYVTRHILRGFLLHNIKCIVS